MKVVAFGASTSKQSINKQLAAYTANLVEGAHVEVLDLNKYQLPLFSQDIEAELGQPEDAQLFLDDIAEADALVVSFAEHNGSYTAAYKNLFDWASRINMKVFQNKPMIMLATSPGPGGASSVLSAAVNSAPYFDGDVVGSLSVPSFFDKFDMENQQVSDEAINEQLTVLTQQLATRL